jgi:rhamnosyltransferase
VHSFLGRSFIVTNHSPLRRYYITRNRIIVWRLYWRHELAWVIRDLVTFLKETCKIILYEQSKVAKTSAIVAGVKDGWMNRTGEADPSRFERRTAP